MSEVPYFTPKLQRAGEVSKSGRITRENLELLFNRDHFNASAPLRYTPFLSYTLVVLRIERPYVLRH